MKRVALFLIAAGTLMLGSTSAFAMDYGTMLSNTCIGCHGTDGASAGPAIPSIGGFTADTFTEAMMAYKNDERPSTIMGRIVKAYTEEEIALMAKFFAAKKFTPAKQEADAAKAAKGKDYHKDYCDKCHEEGGKLDVDGSSILAGQWLPYLQYSMADFHSERRSMSKKMAKRMKKMVEDHGESSLDDVSHYYASQK